MCLSLKYEKELFKLATCLAHTERKYSFVSSCFQGSGLAKNLPPNIHILTLEPWKDGTILLRLEHIFEVGEGENLSKPVDVNIKVGSFSLIVGFIPNVLPETEHLTE